jgi:hypothetical protein
LQWKPDDHYCNVVLIAVEDKWWRQDGNTTVISTDNAFYRHWFHEDKKERLDDMKE